MRRDIIVLEITFADGKTATKAIRISLLEGGVVQEPERRITL